MECSTIGGTRDILSRPRLAFLLFWLPGIALAVTARSYFRSELRTVVWTVALTIMGTACIANAARCHRIHCYMTGPFFLITAVVSLLRPRYCVTGQKRLESDRNYNCDWCDCPMLSARSITRKISQRLICG
jgi:hypothetical protein